MEDKSVEAFEHAAVLVLVNLIYRLMLRMISVLLYGILFSGELQMQLAMSSDSCLTWTVSTTGI